MTTIRKQPVVVPKAPVAVAAPAAAAVVAPEVVAAPSSTQFAAAKKRLISISGRFAAAPMPGQAMSLRSAMAMQAAVTKPPVKSFSSLDGDVRRAVTDGLKTLLPTTSPAYQATLKLATSDTFAALDPATQKALMGRALEVAKDPKQLAELTALVDGKALQDMDPAARARWGAAVGDPSLDAAQRADALKFLNDPALAKLKPGVRDALIAAQAKDPSNAEMTKKLLAQAKDPAFTKLPAGAQAGFFEAVAHQSDAILMEAQDTKQAQLFAFARSPDFQKLDPKSQERWMKGFATGDAAVRDRSYERLTSFEEMNAKYPMEEGERLETLRKRGGALNEPDVAPSARSPLPGASTKAPEIGTAKNAKLSVFFKKSGKGIDPDPKPVTVQTVKIDGHDVSVVFPRPRPEGMPSIDVIAKGLAGLPKAVRDSVDQVVVDPLFKDGFMQATQATDGRPNRIFMGRGVPDTAVEMTAMLSHESGHLVAANAWKADPAKLEAWQKASVSDDHWPSDYATASLQEDVAETIQHYYQVKGTPAEAEMKRDMPARYALLKGLLND